MQNVRNVSTVVGVHAQLALMEMVEAVTAAKPARDRTEVFYWVWLALAGVTVLAAGAGFAYCRANGYDGFTGNVRAMRDAQGFEVGIDIGCY